MECLTIPDNGSLVRIFHAVPNAPAVDVYVNDTLAFTNLIFRQFTNYTPLQSGEYNISIFAADTTNPALLSATLNLPEGGIFTAIATGNIDDLQLLILDDTETPTPGESKVRAVHLSPNAPAVNILINDMMFIQDLSFREMTQFASVPPDAYIITVNESGNNAPLLNFRVQLRDNLISTIYILGDGPQLQPLQSVDGSSYLCQPAVVPSNNSMNSSDVEFESSPMNEASPINE